MDGSQAGLPSGNGPGAQVEVLGTGSRATQWGQKQGEPSLVMNRLKGQKQDGHWDRAETDGTGRWKLVGSIHFFIAYSVLGIVLSVHYPIRFHLHNSYSMWVFITFTV